MPTLPGPLAKIPTWAWLVVLALLAFHFIKK